jgi:two-component system response regulator GlrR
MSTPNIVRLPSNFAATLKRTPEQEDQRRRLIMAGFGAGEKPIDRACSAIVTQDEFTQSQIKLARTYAMSLNGRHPITSVYIHGPTGTGKELLAKIFAASAAEAKESGAIDWKFHAVNCAGLPDGLFESLLFGHARGAFTGAVADHDGILVAAGNGTVFLDEIGELPLNQQAKLLRAIQTKRVTPVGATRDEPINCRFVCATHRSLYAMIRAGTFREDLFYRIAQGTLRTTPLSERPLDVPLITRTMIAARGLLELAEDELCPPEICWARGNVRQLENSLLLREYLGHFDRVAEKLREEQDII